ncbi:hypothetical protein D7Z54_29090 [Salibacterium salarium]|uniref:Uncharacterized protein n=1 Tax=Salibacterium salarium TaxID=284579 RepID=A0A3R9QG64_9BACI|nr:hypothetical protein D7Z54_29090 [Salibacterium salarium]
MLAEPKYFDSCGKSTCLETPQVGVFCRGGSSRARGKRSILAQRFVLGTKNAERFCKIVRHFSIL